MKNIIQKIVDNFIENFDAQAITKKGKNEKGDLLSWTVIVIDDFPSIALSIPLGTDFFPNTILVSFHLDLPGTSVALNTIQVFPILSQEGFNFGIFPPFYMLFGELYFGAYAVGAKMSKLRNIQIMD